jgi:uncharacterized membrane-anchored protein YhcB (DUF1043 family)
MAISPRFSPDIPLQNLGHEFQNILSQLERGQPQSPLGAHVQALSREFSQGELGVSCVGLTQESLAAFLAWMLGVNELPAGTLPSTGVMLDVKVQRDRYTAILPSGATTELSDAPALVAAFPQLTKEASTSAQTVRITIPERADLHKVHFCIWTGSLKDGAGIAAYIEMMRATSLLVVVGPAEYRLLPEEKTELRDLIAGMAGVWPVVSDAKTEGMRFGWWEDSAISRASLKLPISFLKPAEAYSAPDLFRDSGDATRRLVDGARIARRIFGSVEALGENYSREVSRVRALKAREERLGRSLEQNSGSGQEREQLEALRELIDKQFNEMDSTIQEQNRKSLLPAGNVNLAVKKVLDELRESDIEQEEGHAVIKLTLRRDFQERLLNAAKAEIKNQYRDDMYVLNTGFSASRDAVKSRLEAMMGAQVSIPQIPFDENAIWKLLRDAMALEISYRGEMPKRGILQRLGQGKQAMMSVMGIVMLAGGLWAKIYGEKIIEKYGVIIAILFIVVFIVSVIFTFKNWKMEDEARLEKEMDRIRDQLSSEIKRLIGEIQREKMTRITETVTQARRDLQKRAETVVREESVSKAGKATQLRQENRDKQKAMDQRSRDFQALSSQISKLRQGAGDVERDISNALRDIAKEAKPA